MSQTLDMIAQLHKLILGIALALCVVGLSIHRPTSTYDDAESEINSLQQGITPVTDQVNDIFQRIYSKSELKSAALAWLNRRGVSQKDLRIVVVPSGTCRSPMRKSTPWSRWIPRSNGPTVSFAMVITLSIFALYRVRRSPTPSIS